MSNQEFFNPLDKLRLAESVARALLGSAIHSLPPERLFGCGIYALYYLGDFQAYRSLHGGAGRETPDWPIYVGSAVPEGARKGLAAGTTSRRLYQRLVNHSRSVEAAENLEITDFRCRYLVVEDIWIPLAESLLIERLCPVWNQILDGFGNHDPGSGRENQARSPWDTLHPGRTWANKLPPHGQDADTLAKQVQAAIDATQHVRERDAASLLPVHSEDAGEPKDA
jgi:hypothetical protein